MIERHDGSAGAAASVLVRANANPIHFAVQTMRAGFGASSANADDGLKVPGSHSPHTVEDSELAVSVGVARMRPFVDKCAHFGLPKSRSSILYQLEIQPRRFADPLASDAGGLLPAGKGGGRLKLLRIRGAFIAESAPLGR